eukprot:7549791-Prorocentrum_lima.AAC.1
MTSSLVGSEMCIRDRIRVTRPRGQGDGMSPRPEYRAASPNTGRRRTTVSYTHLTLPTICSV